MTINECHWRKNFLGLLLANKEIQEPQKISIQVSLSEKIFVSNPLFEEWMES